MFVFILIQKEHMMFWDFGDKDYLQPQWWFHFNEADFFLPNIKWVTLNAMSEYTKLCFDTMEWN